MQNVADWMPLWAVGPPGKDRTAFWTLATYGESRASNSKLGTLGDFPPNPG